MDIANKYAKYIFLLLFGSLAISSVHRTISNELDFSAFYRTAQLFINGNFDFYNIARDKVFTFKYGPIFPIITAPLALLSINTAQLLWAVLNVLALIVAWIYSEKFIKLVLPDLKITSLARLLSLLMVLDLVARNAMQGNINIMLFALMIMSAVFSIENKNIRAALLASIIAATKITPGVIILFFILTKNKKAFIYSCVFCVLFFILIPLSVFGAQETYNMYINWLTVLRDTNHFPFYKHTNQSPIAVIYHLTGNSKLGLPALLAFAVACTCYISHYFKKQNVLGLFIGCMLAYLSLSPIVWIEYHIVMLPLLIILSSMLLQGQLNRTGITLFIIRFIIVHIMVTAIVGERLGILTAMLGQHLVGAWLLGLIYFLSWNPKDKKLTSPHISTSR